MLTGDPHFPPASQNQSAVVVDATTTAIDETAVSFLLKVKIYPFRILADQSNIKPANKATARFGGPETGVVKQVSGDNGVVAFGIDLGLPGSVGGLGYGHQIPFQIFSFSSIQFSSSAPSQSIANQDL